MNIQVELSLPSPEGFQAFRSDVSWGPLTLAQARAALAGSLGGVIAYVDGKTVGMARLVGDGVLNIYIQDVIVLKNYRDHGVGQALMTSIIDYLNDTYPQDCLIGLFAADGQHTFYNQFGFAARPQKAFGPGMHATVSDLAKARRAA